MPKKRKKKRKRSDGSFDCSDCDRVFANAQARDAHWDVKHCTSGRREFRCDGCNRVFRTVKSRDQHWDTKLGHPRCRWQPTSRRYSAPTAAPPNYGLPSYLVPAASASWVAGHFPLLGQSSSAQPVPIPPLLDDEDAVEVREVSLAERLAARRHAAERRGDVVDLVAQEEQEEREEQEEQQRALACARSDADVAQAYAAEFARRAAVEEHARRILQEQEQGAQILRAEEAAEAELEAGLHASDAELQYRISVLHRRSWAEDVGEHLRVNSDALQIAVAEQVQADHDEQEAEDLARVTEFLVVEEQTAGGSAWSVDHLSTYLMDNEAASEESTR